MEVACVAQVVDKDNIATPQEDINQGIHDGWRSLATRRSVSKKQEHVAQDGYATDDVFSFEMNKSHPHDTRDNIVCQGIGCTNDPIGNDVESHWTRLCEVRVDIHILGDFGKDCSAKIVVDVGHDKLPREVEVLGFDCRRRIVEVDFAGFVDLLKSQGIPNLEEVTNFDDSPNRRILGGVSDLDFLNHENILDEVGSHPRFHLQRGMRETRDQIGRASCRER